MYSDIKNGYLRDSRKQNFSNESRIDEILDNCDGTNGMIDYYKSFNKSNEYNHYIYIQSLLNGIDPIDNSKLDNNHFINEYKIDFRDFNRINSKFIELANSYINETRVLDENQEYYLNNLKEWRKFQAIEEGVKPFQILSDEVLENIVKSYKNNNKELSGIKNFPVSGIKWHKYYEIIIDILDER